MLKNLLKNQAIMAFSRSDRLRACEIRVLERTSLCECLFKIILKELFLYSRRVHQHMPTHRMRLEKTAQSVNAMLRLTEQHFITKLKGVK